MPRNIIIAQKRAQDFHKSETLAQTNQIKYEYFFSHNRKNKKIILFDNLKYPFLTYVNQKYQT